MKNDANQSELLETEESLLKSNAEAAEQPATDYELRQQTNRVKEQSDECYRQMQERNILADEAGFEFQGNTRQKRETLISEVDEKIKLLYLELGETPEDGKLNKEAEIRAQELIKIALVLEQAYADMAYLFSKKEAVAALSRKMIEAVQDKTLNKDQVGNLLSEAKDLQKLYISMGISAAQAQQLINYFNLEFKADAVPVLDGLTTNVETSADLRSEPGDPSRNDFVAKFESWRSQIENRVLDQNVANIEEFYASMSAEATATPNEKDNQADQDSEIKEKKIEYKRGDGWVMPNLGDNNNQVEPETQTEASLPGDTEAEKPDANKRPKSKKLKNKVLAGLRGMATNKISTEPVSAEPEKTPEVAAVS